VQKAIAKIQDLQVEWVYTFIRVFMNKKNRYLIDLDILSDVESDTHIYATDLNNTILCMNLTAKHFFKNLLKPDPIGMTIREYFQDNEQAADLIEQENKLVCDTEKAHLFYTRAHLAHLSWIEFLTIKMPIYHVDNTLAGVFGISHYQEKRSALPAYEMGLTKREIECIYLLLEGHTYKEISKKMGISPRTVESYLNNVKNKLACEGSADLYEKLKDAQLQTNIKETINISTTSLDSSQTPSIYKRKNKNKK
jgi:DNA-binding CsgD family transcriptional regulator